MKGDITELFEAQGCAWGHAQAGSNAAIQSPGLRGLTWSRLGKICACLQWLRETE